MNILTLVQKICLACGFDKVQSIQEFIDQYPELQDFLEQCVDYVIDTTDYSGVEARFIPNNSNRIGDLQDRLSSLHQLPDDFVRQTSDPTFLYNQTKVSTARQIKSTNVFQAEKDLGLSAIYDNVKFDHGRKTVEIAPAVIDGQPEQFLSYISSNWMLNPDNTTVYSIESANDQTISLLDGNILINGTAYYYKEDNGFPFARNKKLFDDFLDTIYWKEQSQAVAIGEHNEYDADIDSYDIYARYSIPRGAR